MRAASALRRLGPRDGLQPGVLDTLRGLLGSTSDLQGGICASRQHAPALLPQLAHPYSASALPEGVEEQPTPEAPPAVEDGSMQQASRQQAPRQHRHQQQSGRGWRGGERPDRGSGARGAGRFVPPQWQQHATRGGNDPLVARLVEEMEAGRHWEARRVFEAALNAAPQQQGGEEPPAAPAPAAAAAPDGAPSWPNHWRPAQAAWKVYFTVLEVTSASPLFMDKQLQRMREQGIEGQSSCYVALLKRCAEASMGNLAYTKITEMKELGFRTTATSLLAATDACLRGHEPGFAKRLIDELRTSEDSPMHHGQVIIFGKLCMGAISEFAKLGRFNQAFEMMAEIESRQLRVPAFLLTDIMHQAAQRKDCEALAECVRRLEAATLTFQVVPNSDERVTLPIKVDEGSLLQVLEVAANKGDVALATATFQLLERCKALPNAPSFPREERGAQQPGPQAGGRAGEALASAETGQDEGQEAGAAAAADAAGDAEAAGSPAEEQQHGTVAAEGEKGQQRRVPAIESFQALIHAHAAGANPAGAFEAVQRLQQAYPARLDALSYHAGLPMLVDALSRDVEAVDEAFFLLEDWAQKGKPVSIAAANCVVAACSQLGDMRRAFETVDAFTSLGLEADADTYNALLEGCNASGLQDAALKVHEQMLELGVQPNEHTYHLLVDTRVVAGDVAGMLTALKTLEAAGHVPQTWLLERCVARCERAGAKEEMRPLLQRLFANDYRMVGADAKIRRWAIEGGMPLLTGSSAFVGREDVLRAMRREHSSTDRIAKREARQQMEQMPPAEEEQEPVEQLAAAE